MKTLKASILVVSSFSLFGARAYAGNAASAAGQAVSSATMVMAVSNIGATKFSVPCSTGTHPASCVLMGLSLAQIPLALISSSGSKKSQSDLTSTSTDAASTGTSSTYTLSDGSTITGTAAETANALTASGLGDLASSYAKNAQTLAASGTSVSSDGQTVTLANGKKVASSAMSSADGMKGAGFTDGDIQTAQSTLDAVNKAVAAATKAGTLTNDVSGGGGGSKISSGDGNYSGGSGDISGKLNAAALKTKANVSGMSKKLGNDNIGVAGDDIFEMVSRRYQTRDKINTFLKN